MILIYGGDCPKCGSPITLADSGYDCWFVWCPHCGPIPELLPIVEPRQDGPYVLGYPPEWQKE